MRTLDDLVKYVSKRYPYPKPWWSKAHYEKRCVEIYTSEQVIFKCMDAPMSRPEDIIMNYSLEIAYNKRGCNPGAEKIMNIIESTLNTLYLFFK